MVKHEQKINLDKIKPIRAIKYNLKFLKKTISKCQCQCIEKPSSLQIKKAATNEILTLGT